MSSRAVPVAAARPPVRLDPVSALIGVKTAVGALGIAVVLVMHGVLWVRTGERQFEAQLRAMLSDSARLFALKVGGALQGRAPSAEIGRLEIGLIRAMPQLRLALA